MKLPPYPKYKPSGVEWLGDVPEHWDVVRLGYITEKIGSGKTPRGGAETYQTDGVLLIRSQNVHDSGLRLNDAVFIDEQIDEKMADTRVHPGDVLLNITGASLGRCSIAPPDLTSANVNQHVCIVRVRVSSARPRFVHRAICSRSAQEQIFSFENGSSREGLNFPQIRNLVIATPPLVEQDVLIAFLDCETTKIDSLVSKKRTLIERLKEKRTALISRTVTRGLPPDAARVVGLDPNPKLKPSGVDWLGDVPVHWDNKRLKWAAMFQRGHDLPGDEREEGNVPLVSSAGISASHCRAAANAPGIVTGRYGTIGTFYLMSEDYWPLNTTLYTIDLYGNEPRFLEVLLTHLAPLFLLNSIKSAVPGVDRNDIHQVLAAIPSYVEQCAIADFLDRETLKIDRMISKVEAAIKRVQEYRTALITAAVTGKIDVRGVDVLTAANN